MALHAQTYNTIYSFCSQSGCVDGDQPQAVLVQGTNGDLFGTTEYGGTSNDGTVFRITLGGRLTTLHSFEGADGDQPFAGLVQSNRGLFYGSTRYGGANDYGTLFTITAEGALTTLLPFAGADGEQSESTLVQATNGDFYGTTNYGGNTNSCNAPYGCGTVFKMTPGGNLETLQNLDSTDGAYPYAGLVQTANGNLYGTMQYGGAYFGGTVYELTPAGALTTLYNFCSAANCTDGGTVLAGLVHDTNGDFYGATWAGGASGSGTIFRITPSGKLTTLYSFCSLTNCSDGAHPYGALVEGTDGNLYGTTTAGGANTNMSCNGNSGCGTVFKITPAGELTTLHTFAGYPTDGAQPQAGLVQETDGIFYGTASLGGVDNTGTVFSLSVGLGPFVAARPTAAAAGAAVTILGNDLTGSTSVTFNGVAATFTVVSASEITTTVPKGATTGRVKVVTPSGTLTSNGPFTILP